jgi:hypothetical protein
MPPLALLLPVLPLVTFTSLNHIKPMSSFSATAQLLAIQLVAMSPLPVVALQLLAVIRAITSVQRSWQHHR